MPPRPGEPRRSTAPQRASERPQEHALDTEGIDPRLLRAARRLEAERSHDEEIDPAEIELVDEPSR
jgi:hypothetical protein